MAAYTCKQCGQSWPENYCPACHATIDRDALAAPVSGPLGRAPSPAISQFSRVAEPLSKPIVARGGTPEDARFTFTGRADEYFRIWIVNVALTVLTLGIYAAWAKVRKRRYFWSNTQLDGRGFEYTGNPIAILKGNLILGAGAVIYIVALRIQPLLGLASAAGIWLVYPWLFQKAMRFNAWNTRYRNIRFGFHGSVGESYAINLGLFLLVPLTLGLLWPYVQYRRKHYQLGKLSFGNAGFRFTGTSAPYYEFFFKALGLGLVGLLIGLASGFGFGAVWVGATSAPAAIGLFVTYMTTLVVVGVYYPTRVTNRVLGQTSIDGVASLRATMGVREVLGMELVNLLAIVFTLGLATPWAAVRRAQYRWSHIEARFTGPVESVTAAAAPEPGAFGDVAADQLDIDISL